MEGHGPFDLDFEGKYQELPSKNGSCKALEVLLGCLQNFNKEEVLRWEDEEGNNALHTAISENQTEAVKLLIKYMEVNTKNRQGLTALDIFYNRHDSLNAEVEEILLGSKAKRASEVAAHPRFISRLEKLPGVENSPVTYYSRKLPLAKCIRKICGGGAQSINEVPLEVRNVLLVVAMLITTTTYQAAFSPPGGYWQDDGNRQHCYQ
ncbi:hypothetical protein Patl1_19418 [Pistacia atlantica]|uniref:Uncharacterized protein n=1 Tax=Pistacia atlantica TaxID=434234 RepID=A0ACC1C067_9ROSI|nr:hypothetical protein Patl1_19418 [Pistacia atlantica]